MLGTWTTRGSNSGPSDDAPDSQRPSALCAASPPQKMPQPPPPPPPTPSSVKNLSVLSKDLPPTTRLVAVRYFLDRPGYGLDNSAVRLWFDPPERARPRDLDKFLRDQKIALEGLLVEVHLDRFGSYMMLDACAAAGIEWEFNGTTPVRPAILSIRLTELTGGGADASAAAGRTAPPPTATGSGLANTTPAGLFAFSMANGLQCASKFYILFPGSLNESFILMWAPFMLFLGGLQFVAALFEVVRGNIYGCTAFMFFGVLWAGNGLTVLLQYSFASSDADASGGTGSIAPELVAMQNPWFAVVTDVYTLAFLLVLLVQTFAMNKVSTLVISLVSVKIFLSIFSPWSTGAVWAQFVAGWTTSAVAFYAFAAELANQIWHREMLPQHKWNVEKSPGEVFGAQGKIGTLQGRATQLRQAQYALSPLQLRVAAESEGDKDVGPASERPERTGTAAAPEGGSQQRLRTHRRFVSDPGSMFS